MVRFALLGIALSVLNLALAQQSAIDLAQDIYRTCLKEFSIGCVKPKALTWMTNVVSDPVIRITDDLVIVKKDNPRDREVLIILN